MRASNRSCSVSLKSCRTRGLSLPFRRTSSKRMQTSSSGSPSRLVTLPSSSDAQALASRDKPPARSFTYSWHETDLWILLARQSKDMSRRAGTRGAAGINLARASSSQADYAALAAPWAASARGFTPSLQLLNSTIQSWGGSCQWLIEPAAATGVRGRVKS